MIAVNQKEENRGIIFYSKSINTAVFYFDEHG